LIAAIADQSTGIVWIKGGSTQTSYVDDTDTTGTSTDYGTGQTNTNAIITQAVAASNNDLSTYAAGVCDDYSVTVDSVTYDDWFLPSIDELAVMKTNLASTPEDRALYGFADSYYWSSSEGSAVTAGVQRFGDGYQHYDLKYFMGWVRAVRAF